MPPKSRIALLYARLSCTKSPCDEVFDPIQSDLAEYSENMEPMQVIYNVNHNNSIVSFSCNDSNIEHFSQQLQIYANTPYELIDKGPIIYVIFEGQLKEMLVLPTDKIKKCTNVRFAQNLEAVEYGKVLRAYLTKPRSFTIPEAPKNELRIDTTVSEVNEQLLKPFNVTFYGTKEGGDRQKIEQFTIKDVEEPEATLDFNIIVKAQKLTGYKKLELSV